MHNFKFNEHGVMLQDIGEVSAEDAVNKKFIHCLDNMYAETIVDSLMLKDLLASFMILGYINPTVLIISEFELTHNDLGELLNVTFTNGKAQFRGTTVYFWTGIWPEKT